MHGSANSRFQGSEAEPEGSQVYGPPILLGKTKIQNKVNV